MHLVRHTQLSYQRRKNDVGDSVYIRVFSIGDFRRPRCVCMTWCTRCVRWCRVHSEMMSLP